MFVFVFVCWAVLACIVFIFVFLLGIFDSHVLGEFIKNQTLQFQSNFLKSFKNAQTIILGNVA